MNANAEGGVFLLTSSVAGIAPSGSSMAYSVTKAAGLDSINRDCGRTDQLLRGLHLVKCLASTQGPKIRVNAILPGLLMTEWVRFGQLPCVLKSNANLGRQLQPSEASRDERQSLPKERGWFCNIQREVSCKLIFEQTGLEDCADAFVAAARNSSMTGQNIQIGAYFNANVQPCLTTA